MRGTRVNRTLQFDPDLVLALVEGALEAEDFESAALHKEDLRGWLQRGGRAPNWMRHPEAAQFVREQEAS
jgi:hypothetical protein